MMTADSGASCPSPLRNLISSSPLPVRTVALVRFLVLLIVEFFSCVEVAVLVGGTRGWVQVSSNGGLFACFVRSW